MPQYRRYLDFSGGLNDTVSELKRALNEGPEFLNVNLDRDGAVSKRLGSQKLTATQIGATLEGGAIFYFQPAGGTAVLVVVAGAKIVKYNGATWDTLYSTLTPNRIALLVPFKNLLYIANAIDNPLVYAPSVGGTNVFRPGQPAPATHPTFNANIAGAMTAGDILVRVRYVSPIDDSFVGEPDSEDGTTFTVSGTGGVRINIPVPPAPSAGSFRTAKRLIERTKVGGGVFFIDGYVNDATTTTYDIVQSDTALEGNDIAPDLGSRLVPSHLWPFCVSRNRIVGWNAAERRVEWSTIDEFGILPEAFREEDFQYLDITDGEDEPVACLPFADHVVFYCGRSLHRVFIDEGGQSAAFRLEGFQVGFPSPRGVIEIPGGHLAWSFKGPFLYDGDSFIPIGERIENFVKSLEASHLGDVYAVHRYDRRQIKFVLTGPGSSKGNIAALYHYRRASLNPEGFPVNHAWAIHDGFEAKSGTIGRDTSTKRDVEYSVDYNGFVRVEDIGNREDFQGDGRINGAFTTAWFDCDNPFFVKQFFDGWAVIQSEAAGNITVAWETEFQEGIGGSDLLNASEAVARFDTAVFDSSTFAGGQNRVIHFFIAQDGVVPEARYIRFRFSNSNADEPFTVLGVMVSYEPIRDRSERV